MTTTKQNLANQIENDIKYLGDYTVRLINDQYLLELSTGDRQDMISRVLIEIIESYGLKLRHITVDGRGLPIVRFDFV